MTTAEAAVIQKPEAKVQSQEALAPAVGPESPEAYWQRLAGERIDIAEPIQKINDAIARGVPNADAYPGVFQDLDQHMSTFSASFPRALRSDVAQATDDLLTDALYAVADHVSSDNHSEGRITLTHGREVPYRFAGSQPLEVLHKLGKAMARIGHVLNDPTVQTVRVNDNASQFSMFRFIDPGRPGSPAVHVYIRPSAAFGHDPALEYGKARTGVDPSISFNVDIRDNYELSRTAFIGEISRTGLNVHNLISLRIDRDGYRPTDWLRREVPHQADIEYGTATFDGGSIIAGSSLNGQVGTLLGHGNHLRMAAMQQQPRFNHVPLRDELGKSDTFAAASIELVDMLEARRLKRPEVAVALRQAKTTVTSGSVEPIVKTDLESREHVAWPLSSRDVLERARTARDKLAGLLHGDGGLAVIAHKFGMSPSINTLPADRVLQVFADTVAPNRRDVPRWQTIQNGRLNLDDDEQRFILELASELGLVTTPQERHSMIAIPNEAKAVLVEGGANRTSIDRRNNARELIGDDPRELLWQVGSGRYIPRANPSGVPNPEFVVVTSDDIAGRVLSHDDGTTEYAVNVASGLQQGWVADLSASVELARTHSRILDDATLLVADAAPNLLQIKPRPADHGRASLETAIKAMHAMGGLNNKTTLLIATSAQYAPKSTLQAALELRRLGLDNMRVQAVGDTSIRTARTYLFEIGVLSRILGKL